MEAIQTDHLLAQNPQIDVQPKPFFERLPYDVRIIIYDYLEPGDLPPFSRGFQVSTLGFILSCRNAKTELEGIATTRLAKYLRKFRSTLEQSSGLKFYFSDLAEDSTLARLRQVTLMMPYSSWPMQSVQPDFQTGVLALFKLFLDKVHFKFYGSDDQWAHESLLDRGQVEVGMHRLLSSLLFQLMPQETMNTKRICFSWDLSGDNLCDSSDLNSKFLNGKLHRDPGLGKEGMVFYRLRDEQRLAGETGIDHATRWELTRDADLIKLFNGVSTLVEYCPSDGQGQQLKQGLVRISETEFEAREEEMEWLIYGE